MRLTISDSGDRSVGIWPNVMEIEWNTGYPDDVTREDDKRMFAKFAREYLDFNNSTDVVFDDECVECGRVCGEGVGLCQDCAVREIAERL
jgi:hypothetical protein